MMIEEIIKLLKNELVFVFFSGFVIGIGSALVCYPEDELEHEKDFIVPVDAELEKEIADFASYIGEEYEVKEILVTVEKRRDK